MNFEDFTTTYLTKSRISANVCLKWDEGFHSWTNNRNKVVEPYVYAHCNGTDVWLEYSIPMFDEPVKERYSNIPLERVTELEIYTKDRRNFFINTFYNGIDRNKINAHYFVREGGCLEMEISDMKLKDQVIQALEEIMKFDLFDYTVAKKNQGKLNLWVVDNEYTQDCISIIRRIYRQQKIGKLFAVLEDTD